MLDAQQDPNDGETRTVQTVQAALTAVRAKIISLIAVWAVDTNERYADLRSKGRTPSARQLLTRIREGIEELEQKTGSRVRKRRARSGAKFLEALERFVGDLLRARAGTAGSARIYRPVGKSSFKDDPVKYDMFIRALDGLKTLGLVGHRKGQTRYHKSAFWSDHTVTLSGRAARFWATGKLIALADAHGIHPHNINDHFAPEPPRNPLVLRDHGTGKGAQKQRGPIIRDYPRTPQTEKLEADVRELNEFLARFSITGGRHEGYTRNFNLCAWDKGGRLSSQGKDNYQQIPKAERHKMTINGEPVAEIDIKASHLTIYHARLGAPLEGSGDPYARAGVDRSVAKQWMLASFGNSNPATRWPSKMIKDYKKEEGKELRRVARASDVARKMLAAFPALQKLEDHSDIWADLQFIEAEAVIGAMLILMRTHGVPSLSMHDGIIVPRSKTELAKTILTREYRRVVGVEPMLTVEPEEEPQVSGADL